MFERLDVEIAFDAAAAVSSPPRFHARMNAAATNARGTALRGTSPATAIVATHSASRMSSRTFAPPGVSPTLVLFSHSSSDSPGAWE